MTASAPPTEHAADLAIIGTGMAGMAAALFSANRGIATAHVGVSGQINFASGLIDLMGVHPVSDHRVWDDPWAAIAQLALDESHHPYARLNRNRIETALDEVVSFLDSAGIPYFREPDKNQWVLTAAGTAKPTHAVPASMADGCRAKAARQPCLIIGFEGLKGFSPRQIVEHQRSQWPGLRGVRVRFPGMTGELYGEHLARSLETAPTRQALAETIQPHLGTETVIGFPAVLGVGRSTQVVTDLERLLGRTVFEIPTMVPAVTGLRLREAFEQRLPAMGIHPFYQQPVTDARLDADGHWRLAVGQDTAQRTIVARTVILASGRFLGKGLHADRNGIRETIFDLPVRQPAARIDWHHKRLFHPAGHALNRCGLSIDDRFRPVDAGNVPIHRNLFAAGAILADQDWARQKCGSGLAIATAAGAIAGVETVLGQDVTG